MNAFDFLRMFWILGVSLKVIQITDNLTDLKSPRALNRNRLKAVGVALIAVGVVIAVFSALFLVPKAEFAAVKGTGLDIISLGFSCLIQLAVGIKKSHKEFDYSLWWIMILIGLIIGIVGVFKPFQIGSSV